MIISRLLLKNSQLVTRAYAARSPSGLVIGAFRAYTDQKQPEAPLTSRQKLKKAAKEYGGTVIVFHVGISLLSLGTSYMAVSSGLDVEQVLQQLGLGNWMQGKTVLVSNAGTFAVAYAIHKMFAPVRIAITLGSVPLIVRYLRRKGVLKK